VDRIGIEADAYNPRPAPAAQQQIMPMQIPVDSAIPLQIPALDGKPLTAMEYRAFFEVTKKKLVSSFSLYSILVTPTHIY
jgi:hypothetical protein